MAKLKLSAKDVLTDLRAGATDDFLMKKYGLSEKGLNSLFQKLLSRRVLSQKDLDGRASAVEEVYEIGPEDIEIDELELVSAPTPSSNEKRVPEQMARAMAKPPQMVTDAKSETDDHTSTLKRRCPFCSEEILSTAMKCKHCGEWFQKRDDKPLTSPRVSDNDDKRARKWAVLCYVAAIIGVPFLGVGSIVGPLIIWLVMRGESPFVDEHGKEAIRHGLALCISGFMALMFLAAGQSDRSGVAFFMGLACLLLLLLGCVITIKLAISASNGKLPMADVTQRFRPLFGDEKLVKEGWAMVYLRLQPVQGGMYLTNQTLVFRTNDYRVSLPLSTITEAVAYKWFGMCMPGKLEIKTSDGYRQIFYVKNREDWLKKIREARDRG